MHADSIEELLLQLKLTSAIDEWRRDPRTERLSLRPLKVIDVPCPAGVNKRLHTELMSLRNRSSILSIGEKECVVTPEIAEQLRSIIADDD